MIVDYDLVISPLRIYPEKLINMAKSSSKDSCRTILNGSKWEEKVEFYKYILVSWSIMDQLKYICKDYVRW